MPNIYDNIDNKLLEGLENTLDKAKRADYCIGYFNLRGWGLLYDKVDKLTGEKIPESEDDQEYYCRLLIGMQELPGDYVRYGYALQDPSKLDNKRAKELKNKLAKEFRDQLMFGIPTEKHEQALKKLLNHLRTKRVVVKLHLRYKLHAKLYLHFRDDYSTPIISYLGSSNLTLAGISKQGELNVDVVEQDAAKKLVKWFQDRWEDHWCLDITDELIEILENSWASDKTLPPYYIYLKMAYHLSREARAGFSEFNLTKDFKNELLPYQASAVKVAAHHLYKRGGVLIGDVVGLGKTITATALAKIFEEDFFLETLIICPKNLVVMWEDYVYKYHLLAKVMSITEVQNKLADERRYRLMIIDESHNLRNRDGKRYRAILEYIQLNECKVIMLTATPYNKTYLDMSSQLRLFISPDENIGISPDRYIESLGGVVQFSAHHEAGENTIAAFEHSLFADDWRELMRLFLVRRTRSFIKNNYAETDESTGRKYLVFPDGTRSYFPDRIPKKIEFSFSDDDPDDQYARLYSQDVIDLIDKLSLPRYGLGQNEYLNKKPDVDPTEDDSRILSNLSQAGARLIGFARTNMFKRLESSGNAFLLSVGRHLLRNFLFIYAFENKKPFPIGKQDGKMVDDFIYSDKDSEEDDMGIVFSEEEYRNNAEELYDSILRNKFKQFDWVHSQLFNKTLYHNLLVDSKHLLEIIEKGKDWKMTKDRKLQALIDLCTKRHPNEKLLIFTQYSDTADYLIEGFLEKRVGKCEVVTGDSENPTSSAYRFSPESNGKRDHISAENEIRVLITTDVLSEGQNLQDGHIVVNYDLPWAIIRLIQRAGRVDRIGQKADEILCYSFLPEKGIETIINLRGRLTQRIRENAETVGSDETFFDGDPINIEDLYNEKSGILDEEETDVDLASYAYQIWKNATDQNPPLKKIIPDLPNVVYSTKKRNSDDHSSGVIIYTKTQQDNDVLVWVNEKGEVISHSQYEILKVVNCEPDEKGEQKLEKHHDLVLVGVKNVQKVEKKVGGQLGKKSGARYRTFMHLDRYMSKNMGTLFVTDDLKRAHEEIYQFPLKESAKDSLNRSLKMGAADEDLANLVIALREDDKLCIISETESMYQDPQIICSMGLR